MRYQRSRRELLGGLTLAGAAGFLGLHARPVAAEPPPETTRLRLTKGIAGICAAPQWVAEELLRGEGFSDVQYVATSGPLESYKALASGEIQIGFGFSAKFLLMVDEGEPIVFLAGGHVGCFELFGADRVRAIRDLKGKTVAVLELGGVEHLFLASMAVYVGLNPRQDIDWVTHPTDEAIRLLAEGKIDAYLAFPPGPQGATGEENRPRGGQQQRGSALVPILLLPGSREPRVRAEAPYRHETGAAGAPEGSGHLRP
jgi:NitT/TauT family transport system substrate-binding protein